MYNGDLQTLRNVTCGNKLAYYQNMQDGDWTKLYQSQKARNELVKVESINAVRVDGNTALVEVTAVNTSTPNQPQRVAINLQKQGDNWKVCDQQ